MQAYLVRQPILDENDDVYAYEILYAEGDESSADADSAAADTIENLFLQLNSDNFLEGKIAFVTFTPNLLFRNVPKIFSEKRLVIQIEDSTIMYPNAHKTVEKFKRQGYRVALKGFEFNSRYFTVLDTADIIKLNFKTLTTTLDSIVDIARTFQKDIIAYNVNTAEARDYARKLGIKHMQGSYIADAKPTKVTKVEHLQSNFFQLMVAITKDEPNVEEIEEIISRDVTLTYSLVKLVNSAYFALRTRARSVKQALIILGLGQLKQWIYLLSFKRDDGQMPAELIKASFLRANFCSELMEFCQDMPISKPEAYLMGMFSTLGALLQVPLEVAISELCVSDEVKAALFTQEGRCGLLFKLVLCYEKADWIGMANCAEELGIPSNVIAQKYFECVESVNATWDMLVANPVDEREEE